jgi:phosphoglycerate dehydrogenase-like enzyme
MLSSSEKRFRVAITADFYSSDGSLRFRDIGLSQFSAHPQIEHLALKEFRPQVGNDQLRGFQGLITGNAGVTANSLTNTQDLLAIARFGVGYDDIDVGACTEADVVFLTAPGSVDYSMAEATVGWMIALSHHVRTKDRLVREGRWDLEPNYMGCELRDRVFGSVGFGGIARATVRLLRCFGMKQAIAYDPYVKAADIESNGVQPVSLEELMTRADFVSIHCPLNKQTRNLITKDQLSLMKPEAYLINTARGGIVNEDDLFEVLLNHRIAGAALDVFVGEPFNQPHRFGQLENVLLAPHSIGHTHEAFRDIGAATCHAMVELAYGRKPSKGVINPEVFDRPGFRAKWERVRLAARG